MSELSVFIDESGDSGSVPAYYLLVLVFHEQAVSIGDTIRTYEQALADRELPDIPFHLGPLLNGHDAYRSLGIPVRKELLHAFRILCEHFPITYHVFAYKKAHFSSNPDQLENRMKRDLINFMFDNLDYLQTFDCIKLYYDGGQSLVQKALHDAVGYALAREAVTYRMAIPADYRLAQVADYLCGLELTSLKYANGGQTATDEIFFGGSQSFKKNFLRKVRRHRL